MTSTLSNTPARPYKPSARAVDESRRGPHEQPPRRNPIRSVDTETKTVASATTPPSKEALHSDAPPVIAAVERQLAIWQMATEDERLIAVALCDLGNRIQADGIESYIRFGDFWNTHYPKEDHKNYKRGMGAVVKGASMSPYSASQVYTILKTIRVYSRAYYEELREKAVANGVILTWTNLRTIAGRLGSGELRNVRRAVEKQLVSKTMSTRQLNVLIDELAPQTVKVRETNDDDKPVKVKIASLISAFKRSSSRYQGWLAAITKYEDEFQGDDPKEVKMTLDQVRTALDEFERMEKFLRESRPILEMFREQVTFLADNDPNTAKKTTERIAGAVKERINADKQREQIRRQQQVGRLTLSGEFSDDNNTAPRAVFRDGDEYRPQASARDDEGDEYADTEEDDSDDEEFESDEEELDSDDEWEDDLDEEDDSIFDEMDAIADDDIPAKRRR
jgi:hypothetical protein